MSRSLLAGVEQRRRAERVRAFKLYAEIIGRADEPRKGDAAKLARLMKELDLSPEDVDADVQAVKTLNQLQEQGAVAAELQAQLGAASREAAALWTEVERVNREARALHREASNRASQLGWRWKAAKKSAERAEEHKRQHWRALGLPKLIHGQSPGEFVAAIADWPPAVAVGSGIEVARRVLREAGYLPDPARPGVWKLDDGSFEPAQDPDPAPEQPVAAVESDAEPEPEPADESNELIPIAATQEQVTA